MKKVLILTCSTGEGHNSAARAVETALLSRGIACEVADPVSFKSEKMQNLVSSLYNVTIQKAPAVFGAVYMLGDLYAASKLPSPVYWANSRYSEPLRDYILSQGFDAVVCTHLYGMEAMTAIRKGSDFPVPCYGVLTDYVCIPFLDETRLTGFFVPNRDAKEHLMKKGIPEESILISGIPVNDVFRRHPEKAAVRQELEIPTDKKIYLIMTGGVGCENMEHLCQKLLVTLDDSEQMIVLTGRNDELRSRLDGAHPGDERLRTVPFTTRAADFMAAADVMLSKPGGLSSTEAAVANVPLVHIHAIPGCETYNASFFSRNGLSRLARTDAEAVSQARALAHDPEQAELMRKKQRTLINPRAAEMIARKVCGVWNCPN